MFMDVFDVFRSSMEESELRGVWNRKASGFKNSHHNGIIGGILELELVFVQ